jgi:signal transduction histidine kinase
MREVTGALREMTAGLDGRQAVCEAARRITGASAVMLYEPATESGGLPSSPTASAGAVDVAPGTAAAQLRYGLAVSTWMEERTRVVQGTAQGTLLFEPVLRDGAPSGVLCLVFGPATHGAARRRRAAVKLLAAEAAVAIERAELASRIRASTRAEAATRLARDLHDSVSQEVALSSVYADLAVKALDEDLSDARELLSEAARQLTRAQEDMREVLRSLREGHRVGAAASLPELVDALAAEHERRGGAAVSVSKDVADWESVAPEATDTLYYVIREALHNALRHAPGSPVNVELHADGDRVRALVRDHGPGFDPARVPDGRWGLTGMRERAQALGGRAQVTSRPGHGTTVAVSLPRQRSRGTLSIVQSSPPESATR